MKIRKEEKKKKEEEEKKNVHTAFAVGLIVMLNMVKDLIGAICSGKAKLVW